MDSYCYWYWYWVDIGIFYPELLMLFIWILILYVDPYPLSSFHSKKITTNTRCNLGRTLMSHFRQSLTNWLWKNWRTDVRARSIDRQVSPWRLKQASSCEDNPLKRQEANCCSISENPQKARETNKYWEDNPRQGKDKDSLVYIWFIPDICHIVHIWFPCRWFSMVLLSTPCQMTTGSLRAKIS